jgi:hypothetical protein
MGDPIVYIDRLYADHQDSQQPWPRRRSLHSEPGWEAVCDYGDHYERETRFTRIGDAIAWGRRRSNIVLVRLGTSIEAMYTAGRIEAIEDVDGVPWPFPPWPPKNWPNYAGPPEPDWPAYPANTEVR